MNVVHATKFKRDTVLLDKDQTDEVKYVYMAMFAVWFIVSAWMLMHFELNFLSKMIMFVPFIVFMVNIIVPFEANGHFDPKDGQSNIISVFFIVVGSLISWHNPADTKSKHIAKERKKLFTFIALALFFVTISLIDVSMLKNEPLIETHIDSALNILSVICLSMSVTEFIKDVYGTVF